MLYSTKTDKRIDCLLRCEEANYNGLEISSLRNDED
jgi:hypothetical protein